jgi:hypothetical protein
MNVRLSVIRQQRRMLKLRSRSQRLALTQHFEVWRKPLSVADFAVTTVRNLRVHPLAIAVATAFLLATPRHRITIWAGRFLTGWEIFHLLRQPGKRR